MTSARGRGISRTLQRLLLLAHGVAERSGVLARPRMRSLFETSYRLYKHFIEARYLTALQDYVRPGTIVVDVGANIGFFTCHFARWTGKGGCVFAIEPESKNFERLCASIQGHRFDSEIVPVHAAAAERTGEVRLHVDPAHPGGHHLAPQGVLTRGVTVDDLVRSRGDRAVSFIKIDVQGAELRVLQGSVRTLESSHPALLVELDEGGLRAQGASVAQVVDFLGSLGYRGHFVSRTGASPAVERPRLIEACLTQEYVDVLFVHEEDATLPPGAQSGYGRPLRE